MSWQSQKAMEQEEDALIAEHDRGEIDASELSKALNELHREYARMARDAAEEAYEAELNCW